MKIAIFTDTFSPQINGVTKNLDRLIEYFNTKNIKFRVFAPNVGNTCESKYEENIIRINGVNLLFYPELKFSIPNYFRLKDTLNNFKPDIIHLVTPFNIGLAGLYYAKHYDIPFVVSYHTNFDQYLKYYNIKFLESVVWKYLRWFHNQSFCNFCPSRDTLEQLRRKGFKNLDIWGRGIDTDHFSPVHRDPVFRKNHNLEDKIIFLYVGRLAREKNIELLIESFKILNKKYQNKISLVITGDGPKLKTLRQIAPENVIFTGYKTGRELSKVYASADVFAFSSVTETYGNVIIEAMSSGLPVVAIMAGGIMENLIDGYNGIACNRNDINAFAEKLEKMIINPKFRNSLANNARKHALEQTWDEVFESLLITYKRVLNKDYTSSVAM